MFVKSLSVCAGINRHEVGNERVLRGRSSEPLGPEFCVMHREVVLRSVNRCIGGLGNELRKDAIRTLTQYRCAEGNMNRGDIASLCSVLRSQRPQNTPRNFMHENRETSETPAASQASVRGEVLSRLLCKRPGFVFGDGVQGKGVVSPSPAHLCRSLRVVIRRSSPERASALATES